MVNKNKTSLVKNLKFTASESTASRKRVNNCKNFAFKCQDNICIEKVIDTRQPWAFIKKTKKKPAKTHSSLLLLANVFVVFYDNTRKYIFKNLRNEVLFDCVWETERGEEERQSIGEVTTGLHNRNDSRCEVEGTWVLHPSTRVVWVNGLHRAWPSKKRSDLACLTPPWFKTKQ